MDKENLTESYFDGEHFEGHGDKWNAIFGISEKFFALHLRKCIQDGAVIFSPENIGQNYFGISYPEEEDAKVLSIIEAKESGNEFVSSVPFLAGAENEVILKEAYTWSEVLAEGEFAVETKEEKIISFFDPLYAVDREKFVKDKTQVISLSGLAYTLEKMQEQEFVLDHGNGYEYFKDEFLRDNPDKSEADFEPPVIKLDAERFRMMIPKTYTSEYEIVAQIEEIKHIDFLDEKLTVMKVNLEHAQEEEYLYCNIYASESVLGEYEPQVGDGIAAVVCLSGTFC